MNRRNFLKLCGMAAGGISFGLGTSACTTIPKNVNWNEVPDSEFSIANFDEWFYFYKLYNSLNPNLKFGHAGYSPTFRGSIFSGWTPGIDYSSNNIYAAADGIVYNIHSLDTGRLGGNTLNVNHNMGPYSVPTIVTKYAHLGKVYVNSRDKVKRGDILANVGDYNHAKLMMQTLGGNYVDPDNYGEGHCYMKYFDGNDPQVIEPEQKHHKQRAICRDISAYLLPQTGITSNSLFSKSHVQKAGTLCIWDNIEAFRYLEELYIARPNLFSDLSKDKFAEYKKEFYANQSVILTLPVKQ
jgi:hypothetical protein